ncbi:hypothetical protein PRZ61_10710 [Halomonas pacifica]|uniref:hypothetical protein n=1 Tax=Bisbaumannia pacifica TaxID=77098 RepID=UPI00235A0DA6|nr:hypothetical protein [Halomonas pacifica]MDC8803906.1 hypothetical protein [Halomonas pacifica]
METVTLERPPTGTRCHYRYERTGTTCSGECRVIAYDGDMVWFKPDCAQHVLRRVDETEFWVEVEPPPHTAPRA